MVRHVAEPEIHHGCPGRAQFLPTKPGEFKLLLVILRIALGHFEVPQYLRDVQLVGFLGEQLVLAGRGESFPQYLGLAIHKLGSNNFADKFIKIRTRY